MGSGRSQKLLAAAGAVLVVVLILFVIRLNERIDRQEARSAYASEESQCANQCQASYMTSRRRCSSYSYDGTRDWCRDQASSVRSSCLARCRP